MLNPEDCINETCPWSGEPVAADSLIEFNGNVVGFCNPGCRDKCAARAHPFRKRKAGEGRQSIVICSDAGTNCAKPSRGGILPFSPSRARSV